MNKIRDLYNNIKWFIQRGKRGYADCDVWDLDMYLSKVISKSVKDLQKQTTGVPSDMAGMFDEDYPEEIDEYSKEWKRILGEIVWVFETMQKFDHDWMPVYDETKRESIENFANFCSGKYHVMTKEEMDRYNQGWEHFKTRFMSLWD